jgi:quercetin dioxygenase-like cupin family protein
MIKSDVYDQLLQSTDLSQNSHTLDHRESKWRKPQESRIQMTNDKIIINRSSERRWSDERRPGMKSQMLLGPAQSNHQNVLLVHTDEGALVEPHEILNSESMYFLEGTFVISLHDRSDELIAGDFCYFAPGTVHGLQCIKGPGRFLVVFAPGAPA